MDDVGVPRPRGQDTRRAVLRAAEEAFAKVGYAGARMDDIAQRAGIRRASLVYYFRDKRALYQALLDDLFGELLGRYEAALAEPGPLTERMLRCIDVWAGQVEARPTLLRIALWEMARVTSSDPGELAPRVRPIVQFLADGVRAGQREGVFRDVDPVGFIMSVAGTTAFVFLRTPMLGSAIAPELERGRLATELRSWVARVLFVE